MKNNANMISGLSKTGDTRILVNSKKSSIPFELPKFIPLKETLFQSLGFFQGEGTKGHPRRIEISNSDANLIKLFMGTIENIYDLQNLKWKVSLKYTANSKDVNLERRYIDYWSKQIGIPKAKFGKSQCFIGNPNVNYGSIQLFIPSLALREIWMEMLQLSYNLINKDKNYAKWFLQGVLAADGCPVFNKGNLVSIMVRIENQEEGEIYQNAFTKLGIKANLYPKTRQIVIGRISEMKKAFDLELFILHKQRHEKFVNGLKKRLICGGENKSQSEKI